MAIPALMASLSGVVASSGEFTVNLPAATQAATHTVVAPTNASAGWRFGRDAAVDKLIGTWSENHNWGTPSGNTDGDNFQIRITLNSGTAPDGGLTPGTWYALSSMRTVSLSQTTVGTKSCNLTIDIRDIATLTIQDSQTYTILVAVDPDI